MIPRAKVTLVTGEPVVGKSLFALQVIAMMTQGKRSPQVARTSDDINTADAENVADTGTSLLFSADDDVIEK